MQPSGPVPKPPAPRWLQPGETFADIKEIGLLGPVFDQDMAASHVFYRPTTTQFLDQATLQHVMQGGLLLREVTEAEKETY